MKKIIFLFVFAIFAFTTYASGNLKSKEVRSIKELASMTLTFTDGCGTQWTLTATCNGCTQGDLYSAISTWEVTHNSGSGVNGTPCYQDPNATEV